MRCGNPLCRGCGEANPAKDAAEYISSLRGSRSHLRNFPERVNKAMRSRFPGVSMLAAFREVRS